MKRRTFIGLGLITGTVGIAGCIGVGGSGSDDPEDTDTPDEETVKTTKLAQVTIQHDEPESRTFELEIERDGDIVYDSTIELPPAELVSEARWDRAAATTVDDGWEPTRGEYHIRLTGPAGDTRERFVDPYGGHRMYTDLDIEPPEPPYDDIPMHVYFWWGSDWYEQFPQWEIEPHDA